MVHPLPPQNSRKLSLQQLARSIQERKDTFDNQQVLELLNMLFEDSKNTLVGETGENFRLVQGEAMTYKKIIGLLTKTQAVIPNQMQE